MEVGACLITIGHLASLLVIARPGLVIIEIFPATACIDTSRFRVAVAKVWNHETADDERILFVNLLHLR